MIRFLRNPRVLLSGLALLSLAPLVLYFTGSWSKTDLFYFYWGECTVLASFSLIMHAKQLIVFFLILLVSAVIVFLATELPTDTLLKVLLTFWGLYGLCWIGYIEVKQSAYGLLIKRLTPLAQLFIYMLFLLCTFAACLALTLTIHQSWNVLYYLSGSDYLIFASMAFIVPTFSIIILKVVDIVGPRHFLPFLLGTYYRPQEKQAIVFFLDMAGSSGMAEKLRSQEGLRLIARFIFDASGTIRLHGGDILNFTGDGLVALWPLKQADRALTAIFALRERIEKNRNDYEEEFGYGMVPDFRVGLHAGQIVLGQIGEEKLFLGLYGDVVNTAARLEQMNKGFGTKTLLSGKVASLLSAQWRTLLKPLGEQEVRGRAEKIDVYTLK